MKKIFLIIAAVLIVLLSLFGYANRVDNYKNEELGIEFKYPSKYKKPSVHQPPSHWYYRRDLDPQWSLRIKLKADSSSIGTDDDYYSLGTLHIRAFNSADVSYENLLAELKNDTEVHRLEEKNIRNKKTLIYTAGGESSTAFSFLFGKKYIIQIEMRHSDQNNKTFQRILKTIKF